MSQYRTTLNKYRLDVATTELREILAGNKVMIVNSSSEAAKVFIEVKGSNLQGSGALPFQNGDSLTVPADFDQVVLTWTAQPNEWIELLIVTLDETPEDWEYVRQQRGVIDSIAQTVNVSQVAGSAFSAKTFAATATIAQMLPANPNRKAVLITNANSGNNRLHVTDDVAGADFYSLEAFSSITIDTTAAIHVKTATGGNWSFSYVELFK